MQNAWLDEAQAGIKIIERNISNLRYADDTTLPLWQKVKKYQLDPYMANWLAQN